ncbi:uncharacterized protein LOC130744116 [Lotus japonicus]|uniref:uncharacterized protein LOC130744116 n=1 Tax=Lotus japonicus TaxID=34305 RepID=UPI002585F173|nr:uncharacterized protein LOC130744116 [Lotus japonicus]
MVCEFPGFRLEQERCFRDFMLDFLQVVDDEGLGVFLETLYVVWSSRNDLVFNDATSTVDQMLRHCSLLHPGPAMVEATARSHQPHPSKWSRPSLGTFKINFDVSVNQEGHSGFGFIARNNHSEVLASTCWRYGLVTSPTVAEALSMRWSMILARDLGFRWVVFGTDCSLLFQAWKRKGGGCSFLDSIVRDCIFLLLDFDVFSLLFVRHTGNCAADALASLSFSQGEFVWIEDVPPQLIGIVQFDVLALVLPTSS